MLKLKPGEMTFAILPQEKGVTFFGRAGITGVLEIFNLPFFKISAGLLLITPNTYSSSLLAKNKDDICIMILSPESCIDLIALVLVASSSPILIPYKNFRLLTLL